MKIIQNLKIGKYLKRIRMKKKKKKCLFVGFCCFILLITIFVDYNRLQSSIFGVGLACIGLGYKLFPNDGVENIFGLNLGLLYSERTKISGCSIVSGVNIAEVFNGVQISSLVNCGDEVYGLEISGVNFNYCGVYGAQIGIVNFILSGDTVGFQMGICNYLPLFDTGCGNNFSGLQVGLVNIVRNDDLESSCVKGVQAGFLNSGSNCDGIQLGTINFANIVCGVQFGIINSTCELNGLQFGLLNYNESAGWHKWFPIVNW